MQHVDLKSIDLSPSFTRDLARASLFPSPPLPGGSAAVVCLLAHTLYVVRSVALWTSEWTSEWTSGLSGSKTEMLVGLSAPLSVDSLDKLNV